MHTPSLTGLAERAHLPTAEPITLSTHIQDVVQLLYFEDLTDVILVGWSYGGGVVDGVADLVPERLHAVVNLDGELGHEGHVLSDGWTEAAREYYRPTMEQARQTGWIPPPTQLASIVDPDLDRWVLQRERPQPVGTYTEPYPDHGSHRHAVPHTYLRCGTRDDDGEPAVTALRCNPAWRFRELHQINHLAIFYDPSVIADALLDIASEHD